MSKYNHLKIEKKWQAYWQAKKTFLAKDADKRPKKYILDMFPYPSGAGLHVGHPEGYTATDILSRYYRLKGFNVLHPMGWDAFGLPAENYAIKEGVHPQKTTQKNIKRFTQQIKSLGLSYDWSRELNTSDPEYYKWTQWLFLKFFQKGLAYKKEASVNWCPKDNTVLANEQVVNGCCERCGTPVVQKKLLQWFFKITDYADRLLKGLDKLDWPEPIKTMQKNWIGKSEGVMYKQKIKDLNIAVEAYDSVPQTFMAQTFCVIAPEHPLVKKLIAGTEHEKPVLEFIAQLEERKKKDRFKIDTEIEGVFTGRFIENPFGTGDLPIWVASFVVADYGTGIVNCSAHDERDFEFAKKFGIPLRPVMFPKDPVKAEKVRNLEICYHHDFEGVLQMPEEFKGRKWGEARQDIITYIEKKQLGYRAVKYKIRDWLLSRQRYWGAPIPIIYCENCKDQKENLNILLLHGKGDGGSEGVFFPWLKNELKTRGYEVQAPDMPHRQEPNDEEQAQYVLKNCKVDKNTIIFGHSFGGIVALRLLEKGVKVKKVILAGTPFSGKFLDNKPRPTVSAALAKGFNFKKIKNQAKEFVVLSEEKDNIVSPEDGKAYAKNLVGSYTVAAGNSVHFTSVKEPKILNLILAEANHYVSSNASMVPVPEKDLPVKLPTDVDFRPTGESPLKISKKFKKVVCPNCGGKAERDYDTMDTFVDSAWYFLRYTDPKNKKEFAAAKKIQSWLPVNTYIGGAEHAVLHLLYARFFTMALYDLGMVNFQEPFLQLRNIGLILGPDGEKMSKSRGNVINPDDMVKEFGADSLRMFEMFMGPLEDAKPWQTQGMVGVRRFLERVWNWVNEKGGGLRAKGEVRTSAKAEKELHKLIKKITEDIENFRFNTCISAFMEFHNAVKDESISISSIKTFLILLYPFAPHISEELNFILGNKKSLQNEKWPEFDATKIVESEVEIIVQVNGKIKGKISASAGIAQTEVEKLVKNIEAVSTALEGQTVKRVIYVQNRVINLVV